MVRVREIALDLRVSPLVAVQKTAYRLARRCTAAIGAPDGDRLVVSLRFDTHATDAEMESCLDAFYRELLDQSLRVKVAEETASLRQLLLALAYARVDLSTE